MFFIILIALTIGLAPTAEAHTSALRPAHTTINVRETHYYLCRNLRHAERGAHHHFGVQGVFLSEGDLPPAIGMREQPVNAGAVMTAPPRTTNSSTTYERTRASVEANRLMTQWVEGQQAATSAAQDYARAQEARAQEEAAKRREAEEAAARREAAITKRAQAAEARAHEAEEAADEAEAELDELINATPDEEE